MSNRSVSKVRHYAPMPSFRDRAISAKQIKDGGKGINLNDLWRETVPRYQFETMESTLTAEE